MKFLDRANSARTSRIQQAVVKKNKNLSVGPDRRLGSALESLENHAVLSMRRPNTSAGLQTLSSQGVITGKTTENALYSIVREAKCSEDLYTTAPVLEITDGLDTFRFPTPSPFMPPRSATFQYSPSSLLDDLPGIGVAIGSPSNAPPNWGISFTADYVSSRSRQPPSRAPPPPPVRSHTVADKAVQSKKKSSWKAFGSIFRMPSKRTRQQPSRAQIDEPEHGSPGAATQSPRVLPRGFTEPQAPVNLSPGLCQAERVWHHRISSLSRGGSGLDLREHSDQTSSMQFPKAEKLSVCGAHSTKTPSPHVNMNTPRDDTPKNIALDLTTYDSTIGSSPSPRTPRLDLDLPTADFDRYSIMFEKFLTSESKPSLFERRQSRLRRTCSKDVVTGRDDAFAVDTPSILPQRSRTSPHLTRPLSIHTKELTSGRLKIETTTATTPRPGLGHRCQTAPSSIIPPLSSAFSRARSSTLESYPETLQSDFHSEGVSSPATPTPSTPMTDTESEKRPPGVNEPAWNIITSETGKIASPAQHTSEPYPRVKSPEDLERHIVEVSVARSVSVTRARSRVSRALSTKQPMKPRVVELSKNRKSTIGVLVSPGEEIEQLPHFSEEHKHDVRISPLTTDVDGADGLENRAVSGGSISREEFTNSECLA